MINETAVPVLLAWNTVLTVLCIILAVVLAVFIALSILGRRMQKKQAENQEAMQQASQVMSMLIIDKKRLRLKEAGLPQIVIDQTPKYMRRAKLPIVKAKVGPKIMSLICDDKIFPVLPVKKEVKAVVSGIYIMDVKGSRNNLETVSGKKMGRLERMRMKAEQTLKENQNATTGKKEKSKKSKK